MEFPGVLANDDVSLDIRKGEVFALVGENGAGKTTLMNILYGIHEPTNGEVYIRGRKVERFSPKTAISMGVGMVHQHFMLVPSFTVAQNIVMSREPRRLGVLFDNKAAEAAAQANLLAQPDRIQRFKILLPRFLVEEIRTEDHRIGGKRRLLQLGGVIKPRLHAERPRQRLLMKAGQHHAGNVEPEAAKYVDQTDYVPVVGNAQVAPNLVFLNVIGVDGDDHFHLLP